MILTVDIESQIMYKMDRTGSIKNFPYLYFQKRTSNLENSFGTLWDCTKSKRKLVKTSRAELFSKVENL